MGKKRPNSFSLSVSPSQRTTSPSPGSCGVRSFPTERRETATPRGTARRGGMQRHNIPNYSVQYITSLVVWPGRWEFIASPPKKPHLATSLIMFHEGGERKTHLRIFHIIFPEFVRLTRFGINLIGTGLRVSPYTGWVGQGNRPSLWLKRESVSTSSRRV